MVIHGAQETSINVLNSSVQDVSICTGSFRTVHTHVCRDGQK